MGMGGVVLKVQTQAVLMQEMKFFYLNTILEMNMQILFFMPVRACRMEQVSMCSTTVLRLL